MPSKTTSRLTARRSVPLPDGSTGLIEQYDGRYFLARRVVGDLAVWGQVFSPTDKSGTPAEYAARLTALEDRLLAGLAADPAAYDRRAIHCVVCGAANERGCEHQPAGFRPGAPSKETDR